MHCTKPPAERMVTFTTHCPNPNAHFISILSGLAILLSVAAAPVTIVAEPTQAAAAYTSYIGAVESRLARQRSSQSGFLANPSTDPQAETRLRRGEFLLEEITPASGTTMPGAMLHHWRGTAFVPGARAADFERLMQDFNNYPQIYSPQVLQARILTKQGDHLQAKMRVRQRHVLTVVMDTTYDITFGRLDPRHGYSISRSIQISEIDAPGTSAERPLKASEEHGFLWRLNTYWSYEERDGGLYMQIESVTLTRSIPIGLGWAVTPFVESVPRESLEFTLRATSSALHK